MTQPANLTVQRTKNGYLIRLMGLGTSQQSPAVRDFVRGAIEDGADVVLDLSACDYLDSTCLGCLAMLSRRGNQHGGRFAVLASEPICQRLFGETKLEQVISFLDESPEVLGKPVTLAATPIQRRELGRHLLETHTELANLGRADSGIYRAIVEQLVRELDEPPA